MRWLNNACDLGGFHPSSDGADSEECYFNDGELQGDFFDCALGIGVLQGLFWN